MYKIKDDDIEGIDYINVSSYSILPLGKKLAIGYPIKIETIYGTIGTIRNLISYINCEDYPKNLLSKHKLSKDDIERINCNDLTIDDKYRDLFECVLKDRVNKYDNVVRLFKMLNPDIRFTSYNRLKDGSIVYNENIEMLCDIYEKINKRILNI